MELLRALAVLAEPPAAEHAVLAAALELPAPPPADEHTDVLVFQAYPYASVYLGSEGKLGGDARDRIAGFWRALRAEVPKDVDHVSVLLAALANLDDEHARHALFWEHVASWMPPFIATLRRIGGFFAAWAETLDSVIADHATRLAAPARMPLHLRLAPDPTTLDDMLAPVCTGVVIVRDDLVRCAAELGLGMRAGERRFVLRAWLEQDAPAVVGWLAAEAQRQALAMRGPLASWWRARALATSTWLAGMG